LEAAAATGISPLISDASAPTLNFHFIDN